MSETWGFRLIKFSNWYDFTRNSMCWNVQTCLLFNGKTAFPWRILWQSQRRSQSSHRNGEKVPMASSDGYMFVPPLFQLRILTAASTLRHTSTTTGGLGETWSEYKTTVVLSCWSMVVSGKPATIAAWWLKLRMNLVAQNFCVWNVDYRSAAWCKDNFFVQLCRANYNDLTWPLSNVLA